MKIFNETKTVELQNPDLTLGRLVDDKVQTGQTSAVTEIKEQGHYEVAKEYPNGGKDMCWVVDVQYVAPKTSEPIFEDVKVYIPYSAEELQKNESLKLFEQQKQKEQARNLPEQTFYNENKTNIDALNEALDLLRTTDYKAIQFAEKVLTAANYEPIKQQRTEARNTVRELKPILANLRQQAGLE